jgi:hypothetical protein
LNLEAMTRMARRRQSAITTQTKPTKYIFNQK